MGRMRDDERNLAAEVRAVEEGHRAFVQDDGSILVVSDTRHGKRFRVMPVAHLDGLIAFNCRPEGTGAYVGDHLAEIGSWRPGVTPCKHAALAARRLVREGFAHLNGRGQWEVEDWVMKFVVDRIELPADPLEGLPR